MVGVEMVLDPITIGEEIIITPMEATARNPRQIKDGTRMETREAEASSNHHRIKTILLGEPGIMTSPTIKVIPGGTMATNSTTRTITLPAGVITIIPTTIMTPLDGPTATIINPVARETLLGATILSPTIRITVLLVGEIMTSPTAKVAPVGAMTTTTQVRMGTISQMIKEVRAGPVTTSPTTKTMVLLGTIIPVRMIKEIILAAGANRMVKAAAGAGIAAPTPMTKTPTQDGPTTIPMDGVRLTIPAMSRTAKETTILMVGTTIINPTAVKMAIRPIGIPEVTRESPQALEGRKIALTTVGEDLLHGQIYPSLKAPRIIGITSQETVGAVEEIATRAVEMAGPAIMTRVAAGAMGEMALPAEALAVVGTMEEITIRVEEGDGEMTRITTREATIRAAAGKVEEITLVIAGAQTIILVVVIRAIAGAGTIRAVEVLAIIGTTEEIITPVGVLVGEITTLAAEIPAGAVEETTTQEVATLDGEVARERNLRVGGNAIACGRMERKSIFQSLHSSWGSAVSFLTCNTLDEECWAWCFCRNFGRSFSCVEVLDRFSVTFFGNFARNCTKRTHR